MSKMVCKTTPSTGTQNKDKELNTLLNDKISISPRDFSMSNHYGDFTSQKKLILVVNVWDRKRSRE